MYALLWLALGGAWGPPAVPKAAVPAARWVVDYGDYRCSLARQEGGGSAAAIGLRVLPGSDAVELRATDLSWKSSPARPGSEVAIRLDGDAPVTAKVQGLGLKDAHGFGTLGLKRDFLERFARAARISIEQDGKPLLAMALPQAGRAVGALAACEDDALRGWGIDPAARAKLSRLPGSNEGLAAVIHDGDYPARALSRNEQGTSVVRVTVGADGKAKECRVLVSSGSHDLDGTTCTLILRRGRFNPALDAAGKPVPAHLVTYITWRL